MAALATDHRPLYTEVYRGIQRYTEVYAPMDPGGHLTCAPLGYFYNAPHWGGYFKPPSDLRNYWTDSKNSNGIRKP